MKATSLTTMPLMSIEAEKAHGLSITALKAGAGRMLGPGAPHQSPRLKATVAGLTFPNPLGMAAGYDKNAEVPDPLLALGFGFVEVGTVTPRPQSGNPQPRIFRLPNERGVINRLGFNNEGHEAALLRLMKRRHRGGLVGVNIGANKDSEDRAADYALGITTFALYASYFTVNISSPNTPGLRDLQSAENLSDLLARVMAARDAAAEDAGRSIPVFLKIAPDLQEADLDHIAAAAEQYGLDGLIVSNTTLSRAPLLNREAGAQAGGLSGKPLFDLSTTVLAKMRQRVGAAMPLIGVGGVHSADSALEKIRAGADLVQLYSVMVYEGPRFPIRLLRQMDAKLKAQGETVRSIRDQSVTEWAERPLVG
ncbi:quinone-dependent dihydroorotate dehydrogenase [Notoacmeibacter ruber]|uniref:Dihydroorotate dehydrogenase (quinone) n=1 Tax=Notoacmeibacter ruber TaxID=2670375 RepID=A0A3L7J8Y1_9HYPH|nr:quinone-dependent dihydroorotate dehydrogenase [Notoacmeibacter ruber]RLQ87188.1 quinone-dependent dihydroorotate dehydrogenase [Notoacmeibacter ruber]